MKKTTVVDYETTSDRMPTGEEASIQSIEYVVKTLETDAASGISEVEASARLARNGRNELEGEKGTPFIVVY